MVLQSSVRHTSIHPEAMDDNIMSVIDQVMMFMKVSPFLIMPPPPTNAASIKNHHPMYLDFCFASQGLQLSPIGAPGGFPSLKLFIVGQTVM